MMRNGEVRGFAPPVLRDRRGWVRVAAVAFAGVLFAAAFAFGLLRMASREHSALAPDFTLVDQDGRPFNLAGAHGHPIAIFFGYTHCTDECPLTLAHLAKAMHAPGVASDARVAFITVDPERDSPAALKRYVRLFDPRFIGLTGSLRALEPVYAAYHMPRQPTAAQAGRKSDDAFSHGTTIFYVGRDGAIDALGMWDDAPNQIARNFQSLN